MKTNLIILSLLLVLSQVPLARADFSGPIVARHATSPDGNLIVRITTPKPDGKFTLPPKQQVSYYRFDETQDAYVRSFRVEWRGYLPHRLYVSNSGNLLLISLEEQEAVRLYSSDGTLTRSWDLGEFLTEEEITACAQTGSTLQWLEEGTLSNDVFSFRGPSQRIRSLSSPYTVMRGADETVKFAASINTETGKLEKYEFEEE